MSPYRRSSIKSWPLDERPREKLLASGPERLTDAELLAVVMPTGGRRANAIDRARSLLARFGSVKALLGASPRALAAVPGLGPARIALLGAVGELARRSVEERVRRSEPLRTSAEVYRHCGARLAALRKEQFHVLLLDG